MNDLMNGIGISLEKTGAGISSNARSDLAVASIAVLNSAAVAVLGAAIGAVATKSAKGAGVGALIGAALGAAFGGFVGYEAKQSVSST
jgi:hypothetical protein